MKSINRRRKMRNVDIYKIVGKFPGTDNELDVRWYRGASRYNNGATRYGDKYFLRLVLGWCIDKNSS
ncbi:MAG: hypothetical protein KDC11_14280 [Chitinophagaceae bacterium]|nr:hypothetical protein [Chitinophagaceae bacterium]